MYVCCTVFIHSEDRGPPNRQLSEGLPEGRRDVVPAFSCRGTRALQSLPPCSQTITVLHTGWMVRTASHLQPTCRVLRGDRPSVEHSSVLCDGPHLVCSADRDGLKRLVGADVQPGASLWGQTHWS